MYESFFGLREKPFGIPPDPDYFFLSERHGFAYTMLEYAITNQADFAVITGDIGAGKTTLIRQLLRTLPPTYEVGMLTNTHPDMQDLRPWILTAFDQEYTEGSAVALHRQFEEFVLNTYQGGKTVLLIIDEAQNLPAPALESVRLLSNINIVNTGSCRSSLRGSTSCAPCSKTRLWSSWPSAWLWTSISRP